MTSTKRKLPDIILLIMFIVGVCIIAYPTVGDCLNRIRASYAIASYQEVVAGKDYTSEFQRAEAYNNALVDGNNNDILNSYDDILDVTGTGIIGYIDIPQINVHMPIYHGTSDAVLEVGAGHLQGSSFPIGGESTHAVISAHTGLPGAELFTELDTLTKGDTFTVTVLTEVLTYQVDQINTVLPDEIDNLRIISGEDYITLMTCTPYGINDHRLLVRGVRIPTTEKDKETVLNINPYHDNHIFIMILSVAIISVLSIVFVRKWRKNHANNKN